MTTEDAPMDITYPPGQLTAAEAVAGIDWEQRLRAAVEQTLARRIAQRDERADKQRRRNYGLEQRHARKLARNVRTADNQPEGAEP
jgi:hypothetical protein